MSVEQPRRDTNVLRPEAGMWVPGTLVFTNGPKYDNDDVSRGEGERGVKKMKTGKESREHLQT